MIRLASREAKEFSVQRLQCFGEIDTQTIRSVLISRREKTDQSKVKRSTSDPRLVESEVERVVRVWCGRARGEGVVVLDPLVGRGLRLHLCRSECLVGDVRLQRCGEFAFVGSLDPERASVLLNLNTNAPVSTMMRQQSVYCCKISNLTYSRIQLRWLWHWLQQHSWR